MKKQKEITYKEKVKEEVYSFINAFNDGTDPLFVLSVIIVILFFVNFLIYMFFNR